MAAQEEIVPRPRSQTPLATKIFNCIVDDTALIQGAKKSTRDGIPKWIATGRIRLFVPLYALTKVTRTKDTKNRLANEAAESLAWLDAATSLHPHLITLQEGRDGFENWEQVEQYTQPKTLFSEDNSPVDGVVNESEELPQMVDNKLDLSSDATKPGQSIASQQSRLSVASTSSDKHDSTTTPSSLHNDLAGDIADKDLDNHVPSIPNDEVSSPIHSRNVSNADDFGSDDTPKDIRPLINYVLWLVHHDKSPTTTLDSFVFLTDNILIKKHAQKFGIKTKTLAEVRYVISRENQDAKARELMQQRDLSILENGTNPRLQKDIVASENVRPNLPVDVAQNRRSLSVVEAEELEDEIVFKRANAISPSAAIEASQTSPISNTTTNYTSRGRGASRFPSRGALGRGSFAHRGGISGRIAIGRGRASAQQIDPDSFDRPRPMRGNMKAIWSPP